MMRLSNNYLDRMVLSLRTGGVIGQASAPIINPNNLRIVGWYCTSRTEKCQYILPTSEIREFIPKGLVVNDYEALTHPDDLVRLKEVIHLNFEIIGKSVVTESKKRMGKIADYSVDDTSYYIQKLYINQSLLKSISTDQLIIDRSQIVEITDKKIIISDPTITAGNRSPIAAEA